jgi:hypothetical protein
LQSASILGNWTSIYTNQPTGYYFQYAAPAPGPGPHFYRVVRP